MFEAVAERDRKQQSTDWRWFLARLKTNKMWLLFDADMLFLAA